MTCLIVQGQVMLCDLPYKEARLLLAVHKYVLYSLMCSCSDCTMATYSLHPSITLYFWPHLLKMHQLLATLQ